MREIKFRVWDKINKKWLENFKIYQYGNVSSDGVWSKSDEIEIAQFTGLLDKNGKEIYEGYIINVFHASEYIDPDDQDEDDPNNEHYNKENAFVCKQSVEWSDQGGYFCATDTGEYCPPLGETEELVLEVIGNIYEDSELLK